MTIFVKNKIYKLEGKVKVKFKFLVWRYIMNRCTETSEVWNSKRLWTYLQVESETLFYSTKVFNMAMV
jgi:hypothetical protein